MKRQKFVLTGMVLFFVLSNGCISDSTTTESPAERLEETQIKTTAKETCTLTGGPLLVATAVNEENVPERNVTSFEELDDSKQEYVRRMVEDDSYVQYRPQEGDFPDYIQYKGTIYEISAEGHWDDFC